MKKINYEYPLEPDWNQSEIVKVIEFYNNIELAYEKGVNRDVLLNSFNEFKKIVPMKMNQNNLGKIFEDESGYSIYKTMKLARKSDKEIIRIEI